MTREKAYALRALIEKAAVSLNDPDALGAVELFPHWSADASYNAGDRVRYDGVLYRCLQNHDSQAAWTPADAPSLWTKVLIPDPEVIPEWEQPDSTNPYMKGDKVRYNGRIYESLVDGNVWPPDAETALWRIVAA